MLLFFLDKNSVLKIWSACIAYKDGLQMLNKNVNRRLLKYNCK